MAGADPASVETVGEPRRTRDWKGLLPKFPYFVVIVLGLVGICWTSLFRTPSANYWAALTPVVALLCIIVGWRRSAPGGARVAMIATQLAQWAAVLAAMYLLFVSATPRALLNSDATGLMFLTLLALGVFVSGLHLYAWKLCVTGVFLAIAVPTVAWFEQAALVLVIIGAALIALGVAHWWARGRNRTAT